MSYVQFWHTKKARKTGPFFTTWRDQADIESAPTKHDRHVGADSISALLCSSIAHGLAFRRRRKIPTASAKNHPMGMAIQMTVTPRKGDRA